jgi:uncharacterized protein (DUF1330 family)
MLLNFFGKLYNSPKYNGLIKKRTQSSDSLYILSLLRLFR